MTICNCHIWYEDTFFGATTWRAGLQRDTYGTTWTCCFSHEEGNQLHGLSFVNAIGITGQCKCVKKFKRLYWVHGVKQLIHQLDLKHWSPFGNVLCHFLVMTGGSVCNVIALEMHGCSETIINWWKYLTFVFLTSAWNWQLVQLARTSLTWL